MKAALISTVGLAVLSGCGSKSGLLTGDATELDASADVAAPPTDQLCARADYQTGHRALSLYVLLDRSGSMLDDDKWTQATAALAAFVEDPSAAGVAIGLQYFPLSGTCGEAQYAKPAVVIGELPGHASAIVQSLAKQIPGSGDTPTRPALRGAIEYARAHLIADPSRAVYIALVTDGSPNACSSTAHNVALVAEQGAKGSPQVLTFAIGLAQGFVGDLELIAAQGGTGKPILVGGTTNPAQALIDALRALRDTHELCRFPLPSTPGATPRASDLRVAYRAQPSAELTLVSRLEKAQCGSEAGFFVNDPVSPSHVELCPELCQALQAAPGSSVSVIAGCAGDLDAGGTPLPLPDGGTCGGAASFSCVAFCGSPDIEWPICVGGQWGCPPGHIVTELCESCPPVPHACCKPDGTLDQAACIDGAWQCAPGSMLYGNAGCKAPEVCSDDLPCALDQWCDTPNDACGLELRPGSCKPRLGCTDGGPSVCGCDGLGYPSACAAQKNGVDLWSDGACAQPPGTIACGGYFCPSSSLCKKKTVYEGPEPLVTHECVVPPAGCASGCGCQLCGPCPPGKTCTEACSPGQLTCVVL